ncbi:MAG TPA: Ig-like domain-containing protein [Cytophagaceae bacterium]
MSLNQLWAQQVDLLWLGNSFTGGTELNKYVKGMINAGSSGVTVNLSESNILWGLNLNDHWGNAKSMEMIRSKKYDYVILQGYINLGDIGQATQRENVIKYGILLADEVRKNNAKPIVFCAHANEDNSSAQWDYIINSYKKLADTSKSIFAPASVAWVEAKTQSPDLSLYTEDHHHQNEFSNYLNMCVFYYIITGQSPLGNPYRLSSRDWKEKTLTDDMALKLQQYAASVVERMKGTEIKVTGLSLTPASATMITDETIDMGIKFSPSNASNRRVTWTSSNPLVATVSALGAVTGISIGRVTITAKSDEGVVSASANIEVIKSTANRVTGITLNKTEESLNVGDSLTLVASLMPVDATNKKIKWLSSNYIAVSVDASGKVKGLLGGFSKVTATTVDGSFVASCSVYVKAPVVARGDNPPGEAADKLTNNNLNDKWLDFSPSSWVLFSYNKPVSWDVYELTSGDDAPERDPMNWTIKGSNDNSTWVTLDTRTDESWNARKQTKRYSFVNNQPYSYYKWEISAVKSGNVIQAAEFKFSQSSVTAYEVGEATSRIDIYPNPSSDFINIKLDGGDDASMEIVDLHGNTIMTSKITGQREYKFDLSSLRKGSYLVTVLTRKTTKTIKFVKK